MYLGVCICIYDIQIYCISEYMCMSLEALLLFRISRDCNQHAMDTVHVQVSCCALHPGIADPSLVPSPTPARHFIPGENKMVSGSGAWNETMWTPSFLYDVILWSDYGIVS